MKSNNNLISSQIKYKVRFHLHDQISNHAFDRVRDSLESILYNAIFTQVKMPVFFSLYDHLYYQIDDVVWDQVDNYGK